MSPEKSSLRKRGSYLSLVLIPINNWWLIPMEEFRYSGHPTTASPFCTAIFLLLLLTSIGCSHDLLRESHYPGLNYLHCTSIQTTINLSG